MTEATTPSTPKKTGRRLDPLSIAAMTVVILAIALFATLGIVKLFGTTDSDPVDLNDAIDTEEEGASVSTSSLEVGDPAPSVMFDLLGGGTTEMSELRGSPVVLNFWSSTCAPCLAEMPDFENVHQQLGDEVTFLGVDVTDTEEAGIAMLRQTGVTYPNARDPRAETMGAYGGIALPRTVLVDAEGIVVDIHNGQLSATELTEALADAGLLQ